jgi:hypothetical protein
MVRFGHVLSGSSTVGYGRYLWKGMLIVDGILSAGGKRAGARSQAAVCRRIPLPGEQGERERAETAGHEGVERRRAGVRHAPNDSGARGPAPRAAS